MRVRVLGPLVVEVDGQQVPVTASKQRAVLQLLSLRAGAVVAPAEIIHALWADDPPKTATKTIQTYISSLRCVLPVGVIETLGGGYRLNVDQSDIDVTRFETLVEGALKGPELAVNSARRALEEALALWRGDPLVDLEDLPFGASQIARLEELRRLAEEELVDLRLNMGESASLISELELSVGSEPLRERRWGQLMLALYRSGRQADALRAYQRLRQVLNEQLGLEPSSQLRTLEARILDQDPDLLPTEDVLRHPSGEQFSVPRPTTPLVGREQALSELADLLAGNRLLTLTGPGGGGKTRLALALANREADQFPDGVYWIALSATTDPDLVLPTIGRALQVGGDLASALAGRRSLLVLDNLEQVLAAADQLGEVMVDATEAHWLVTSRERLRLSFEQEYPVPPLTPSSAVELFVQRARQVQPAFEADENVWQICQRLDCLPLAVELASTRVKTLTTSEMVQRMDQRFELVDRGWRDRPDRHATMRAVIDWSYDLLTTDEAATFRGLAAFAGDFDSEAAEVVSGATLKDLQSLIDKSLLHRTIDGRFYLLETTRNYLLEHNKKSNEWSQTLDRHAAYYCERAESWKRQVFFWSGQRPPTDHQAHLDVQRKNLHREADNFRAAMARTIEMDVPLAIRIMNALSHLWEAQGLLTELVLWFERSFARAVDLPDGLQAEALRAYGGCLILSGRNDRARQVIHDSLALYRGIGDIPGQAWCLLGLGNLCSMEGSAASALPFHQEALDIVIEVTEQPIMALASLCLGNDLTETKDFKAAEQMLLQAAETYEAFGDATGVAVSLQSLGDARLDQCDDDDAELKYLEALSLAARNGVTQLIPYCLAGLACVAALRGNPVESGRLWRLKELAQSRTESRIEPLAQTRWNRIIGPLQASPDFVSGHQRGNSPSVEDAIETLIKGPQLQTRKERL